MALDIYRFSPTLVDFEGDAQSKEAKALLGGKGAGLAAMCTAGLPVPPGFTIPCSASLHYLNLATDADRKLFMDGLMAQLAGYMEWLGKQFGYAPLVSVRSGAPISMPGMMDTILNVGLTFDNETAWQTRIGERATKDSLRRLIQMLGETAYDVPKAVFDFQLAKVKKEAGVTADTELTTGHLDLVINRYLHAFKENQGFTFPVDHATHQLRDAIEAVFRSWNSDRAREYRKLNKIPETMGTAVNVQAMVFGNMGDDSGSGVLFTRDPSTGAKVITGEYLANAQGEDVVAGIRTPKTLKSISEEANNYGEPPNWLGELADVCEKLEVFYNDMVDVEFTVQTEKLFILQSRVGKRSAAAALKIALAFFDEGKIEFADLCKRVKREQYKVLSRPSVDPAFKAAPDLTGIPASPGVVSGRPVFTSEDAVKATDAVILVREETSPDDIAGMAKAVGILTKTGGSTSHAAVVARAMDKACVVGALDMDMEQMPAAKRVTIDGATGRVWVNTLVPLVDASQTEEVLRLQELAFGHLLKGDVMTQLEYTTQSTRLLIHASRWWNDEKALEEILTGLCNMGDCEGVTFSTLSPARFLPAEDALLDGCFGPAATDPFAKDLLDSLVENAELLSGLRVQVAAGAKKAIAALSKVGFEVEAVDTAQAAGADYVPADHAVFTVLAE